MLKPRDQRTRKRRRLGDTVAGVLFNAERTAVFVVVAGEVLLVEAEHELVCAVQTDV